eukprot:6015246-Pleurochrysis_carterae.AAC.2
MAEALCLAPARPLQTGTHLGGSRPKGWAVRHVRPILVFPLAWQVTNIRLSRRVHPRVGRTRQARAHAGQASRAAVPRCRRAAAPPSFPRTAVVPRSRHGGRHSHGDKVPCHVGTYSTLYPFRQLVWPYGKRLLCIPLIRTQTIDRMKELGTI